MSIWFCSDFHFGHANIIRYCSRPFKTLEEMNETIIKNHNSRVKENDTVFFLGDFCFKNSPGGKQGEGSLNKADFYVSQLKGKFIFIRGNHDCFSEDTLLLTDKGYKNYKELKIGDIIPTANLDNKIVEYKPIKSIIINEVDKIFTFSSKTCEGKFTNNHELIHIGYNQKRNKITNFRKITCEELWKRRSYILLPSSFISGNQDYNLFTDNELKLLAWIYTDGGITYYKHNVSNIILYQSKIEGIKTIEELLQNLKLPYKKNKSKLKNLDNFYIQNKKVKSQLQHYNFVLNSDTSRYITKKFGLNNKYQYLDWLKYLSDRQVKLFINEMIKGDGSTWSNGNRIIYGFYDFLSNFLGLCVTHGIDANLIRTNNKNGYLCIHKERKNSIFGVRQIYPYSRKIENNKQITWCVNVDNHNIFTSLNGKSLLSGNSNNSLKTPIEKIYIKYGGKHICLVHNPLHADSDCDLNLVGHVHEKWLIRPLGKKSLMYNVGVDVNNFRPISYEEINSKIARWKKENGKKEIINEVKCEGTSQAI